VVVDLALADLK
jgi:hypothetical protein